MSQTIKAPREYKFVDASRRKRRRRNGSTIPKTVIMASASQSKQATTPRSSSRRKQADNTLLTPTQPPEVQEPITVAPLMNCNVVESQMDQHSSNENVGQGNDIRWSFSNLMGTIPDPDPSYTASFPQINQRCQSPIYFGNNTQVEEDPFTAEMSPRGNQIEFEGPNEDNGVSNESPTVNEILLPALSSLEAPSNISLTTTQLMTRYDQEFCVIPLTYDFEANPFRFEGESSQLLFHCILALSYKHINRDTGSCSSEARMHKSKALRMLRDTESAEKSSLLAENFLDAVLILMTLDLATSAFGPWTWYLRSSYQMIQATKYLNARKTPRTQARIEMLIWWDVTLALTSRQGCVLPESTIINLIRYYKTNNETFFDVSGCPQALFKHMIRLGSFARELELVSNMTCAKFDMAPVHKVAQEIRDWSDPNYSGFADQQFSASLTTYDGDIGDSAHYRQDLHHCAEAWRYSLLTYITRVFEWKRHESPPPILAFLARRTLNHVSSCRPTSTLQKQLLLPVFLAGCETADENLRDVARTYCSWWNERSRYGMFLTAHALLEEIWSNDNPLAWWGSFMDQKSRSNYGGGEARQYLLG